jgi:hypothetical protein
MDAFHFDRLTRSLVTATSRRVVLIGAAESGLLGRTPAFSQAKKRKRHRLKRNQFGCVDVGGACRGRDNNCCSNRCDGGKPKKGKRDRSRCIGHDTSDCLVGDDSCVVEKSCLTSAGREDGFCHKTTGNGVFCAFDAGCFPCTHDEDCVPFCGEGAACIVCAGFAPCADIGGRECAGTDVCSLP